MLTPGPRNLITDVAGLRIGQAHDGLLASGVTVLLADAPMTVAAGVFGGGPGTRELDAIALEGTVQEAHALALSGGSAFGLDAATGVQSLLRERGMGFRIGAFAVPIVPQAILFDLLNSGDKSWGRYPPYRELGYAAASAASEDFALGSAGAGYGASVAWRADGRRLRGGLGSASLSDGGIVVGALAAVNAAGTVTAGEGPHFWAAPHEIAGEFGAYGLLPLTHGCVPPILKGAPGQNTTLAIVATDAALTRVQCRRLATMAAAGLARAIRPVFTPLDGDIVFAVSTGREPSPDPISGLARLGHLAAECLARAVARGVYEAEGTLPDGTPSHRLVFRPGREAAP